jgi:tetratricopeptide (TPR) repeat protein
VYDWMQRGLALLAAGHAAAAAELLEHAVRAEPGTPAVREALARAQFDAGRYQAAGVNFTWLVQHDPTDHYAHYGAGLAAQRTQDPARAVELLALAAAMRPDLRHYRQALAAARATVAARRSA